MLKIEKLKVVAAWACVVLRNFMHSPVLHTLFDLNRKVNCDFIPFLSCRCHVNTCHWTQWRSGLFVSRNTESDLICLCQALFIESGCPFIQSLINVYFCCWFIVSHVFLSVLSAVGFILCHAVLNSDAAALSLWKLALQSSTCLCLFRDEVFHIHKAAEDLFVNIRG